MRSNPKGFSGAGLRDCVEVMVTDDFLLLKNLTIYKR